MTTWRPGRPGEPGEPGRVAPDAVEGQVDERAAAGRPERGELLDDHRLVAAELPVVPAVRDVPERDRGVLVGQDPAELGRIDRPEDGLDAAAGRPRIAPSRGGAPRAGRLVRAAARRPRSARAAAASRRGEERLEQGEDPPLGVGAAVAGAVLGRLDQHPVEQRGERVARPTGCRARPAARRASRPPGGCSDDRRDGLAPAAQEHLADRRVACRPRPRPGAAGSPEPRSDCSTARLSNQ